MTQSRLLPRPFALANLMGVSLLSATLTAHPAQALSWSVDTGTRTENNLLISGGFTIDDELATLPNMTVSNVTVSGVTFGATDALISNTPGVGITAIDWLDTNNNLLSFVFNTPLTPSGGTVTLDNIVSSYTPFNPGTPLAVNGSVTAVPEPLTLLGAGTAIALGGIFKRRQG